MDITRAVIAYFVAVALLLATAGFFLNRALDPLPMAEAQGGAAPKPLAPKLRNAAERRAEDAALMKRLAEEKEKRTQRVAVETTGMSSALMAMPPSAEEGEAKTTRKSKIRSADERARRSRTANRSQRQAYDSWSYRQSYDRSHWGYGQRGFWN